MNKPGPFPSGVKAWGPMTLHNGDRLSQEEFHALYKAYPRHVKMELIGGTVFMASPLRREHGTSHPELSGVFWLYKAATPGVELADNLTTILGPKGEPQPDLLLRILTECGGQSRYNQEKYLVGAPELVAEVAFSSRSLDLGKKRKEYQKSGVLEYLVLNVEEQQIHWFHFPSRRRLKPDTQGVWKSRVFPGLWLDGPALIAQDSSRLIAAIQQGLATREHAAFVRKLQAARRS